MKSANIVTALLLASTCTFAWSQKDKAPKDREVKELIAEYVALDLSAPADMTRGDEILVRLDDAPPLNERGLKKWRKVLDKATAKGLELESKPGNHYLYEGDKGLYIVGPKVAKPDTLFIGLHGGGLGSGEASSSHSSYGQAIADLGWVGIYPEVLEKTELGWTTSGTEEFLLHLIDRAKRTWDIDPDRVFLGGHSMGGYGSWVVGAHHADRFAALTPSAGGPTPLFNATGQVMGIDNGVIPNLRNVPIVIYQSDDDPKVPPDANRFAVKLLEKAQKRHGGYDFEYWEVPGRAHDLPPGGWAGIMEKVAERRRTPHPTKLLWEPVLSWKRQFYWLYWEQPVKGITIQAEILPKLNTVRITAGEQLEDFYILLDEWMLDLEQEVAIDWDGIEVYRGIPEPTLSALISTGADADPGRTYPIRIHAAK